MKSVNDGRQFGYNVVDKIKAGGKLLQVLADKVGMPVEELKQYQVFTEVPLETTNGYMRADIVMLKVVDEIIVDAIVIENKLNIFV